MANKFETIEAENEMRDLARIACGECDGIEPFLAEMDREQKPAKKPIAPWMREILIQDIKRDIESDFDRPFNLTSEDLAPGGFIHRD